MNGAGVLPQQLYQLSIAFQNLRKEERETTKQPLDSDKASPEETLDMVASAFTLEELEAIVEKKKRGEVGEKVSGKGRE